MQQHDSRAALFVGIKGASRNPLPDGPFADREDPGHLRHRVPRRTALGSGWGRAGRRYWFREVAYDLASSLAGEGRASGPAYASAFLRPRGVATRHVRRWAMRRFVTLLSVVAVMLLGLGTPWR